MITEIIPSYLYWQYQNDPVEPFNTQESAIAGIAIAGYAVAGYDTNRVAVSDIQAFVNSYNTLAQQYLNEFNTLDLPIYTKLTGYMLDWVAAGVYGITRPVLPVPVEFSAEGPYNTWDYNTRPYNEDTENSSSEFYTINDDYFKRIITWNFYKGDGFQYNTSWLKRRVKRFLDGPDGVDPNIQDTFDVSVTYPDKFNINITVFDSYSANLMDAAIQAGVLDLPFQYNYTVILV